MSQRPDPQQKSEAREAASHPAPHAARLDLPREEAALPASKPSADAAIASQSERAARRRTTLRVLGGTVVFTVAMSAVLEWGGWQRAFAVMPAPHAPIPPLAFLRGMWDTSLGAVGVGTAAAVLSLLLPSTWRRAWRRLPAAFAVGALAFLGFLAFVTF